MRLRNTNGFTCSLQAKKPGPFLCLGGQRQSERGRQWTWDVMARQRRRQMEWESEIEWLLPVFRRACDAFSTQILLQRNQLLKPVNGARRDIDGQGIVLFKFLLSGWNHGDRFLYIFNQLYIRYNNFLRGESHVEIFISYADLFIRIKNEIIYSLIKK